MKLKPLKEASLRVQAARTIRQAIFSGQFPPGAQLLFGMRLTRPACSNWTSASRMVVWLTPRGTSVTTVSPEDVRRRLTIRALLEGLAWVTASSRMRSKEFEHLEKLLDCIRAATEISSQKAEAELAFHCYIWEQSGNATLVRMLDLVTPPLFAFITPMRKHQLKDVKKLDRAHEEVVLALHRGNPEDLTVILREHLESSYGKFLEPGNLDLHLLISSAFGAGHLSNDFPSQSFPVAAGSLLSE